MGIKKLALVGITFGALVLAGCSSIKQPSEAIQNKKYRDLIARGYENPKPQTFEKKVEVGDLDGNGLIDYRFNSIDDKPLTFYAHFGDDERIYFDEYTAYDPDKPIR